MATDISARSTDPADYATTTEPPPGSRGSDYAVLSREVKQRGLLKRRPGYYSVKIGANLLLLAAGWTAFALIGQSWWQLLTAAFLAVMFTQTGFIGHDAGHQQISASSASTTCSGRVHADLLIGLSYGWWIAKHNRHHANPNHVDQTPTSTPARSPSPQDQARGAAGRTRWLARHQAWLFFPMLLLEGSPCTSPASGRCSTRRRRERRRLARPPAGRAPRRLPRRRCSWSCSPVQALASSPCTRALFGLYLGCSFAPNHKGMPMLDRGRQARLPAPAGADLAQRSRRPARPTSCSAGSTTRSSTTCSPPCPGPTCAVPRQLVRAFCAAHGIAYHETGLLRPTPRCCGTFTRSARPPAPRAGVLITSVESVIRQSCTQQQATGHHCWMQKLAAHEMPLHKVFSSDYDFEIPDYLSAPTPGRRSRRSQPLTDVPWRHLTAGPRSRISSARWYS